MLAKTQPRIKIQKQNSELRTWLPFKFMSVYLNRILQEIQLELQEEEDEMINQI